VSGEVTEDDTHRDEGRSHEWRAYGQDDGWTDEPGQLPQDDPRSIPSYDPASTISQRWRARSTSLPPGGARSLTTA
jgi:hypothetical protein